LKGSKVPDVPIIHDNANNFNNNNNKDTVDQRYLTDKRNEKRKIIIGRNSVMILSYFYILN